MSGRGRHGRGRHSQRFPSGLRPVEEGTRISITEQLEAFQRSDASEFTFPADLNNHDRAVVHAECKKYGFTSKSYGKGERRQVVVSKHQASGQAQMDLFEVPFSRDSLGILQAYLSRFPPSPAEEASLSLGGLQLNPAPGDQSSNSKHPSLKHKSKKQRRDGGGAAAFPADKVAARHANWQQQQQRSQVQELAQSRQALPIAPHREEILAAITSNQVVLIAGETGCGKTTQVPQYIMEDCWSRGQGCRVMCTQPRRISAISIAERVAVERGERPGDNVGYTIRLESSGGPNSSLMFCTNGVLLRMLTHGDGLEGVTHVIVDEIHERDRYADFLLILLRSVLPKYPSLRVVLMSATLHIDLFSAYFGGCPVIQVPGFTHPVTDVYLEEILSMVGYQPAGNFAPISRPAIVGPAQLSPKQQADMDDAIFTAFLKGRDEDFEHLLEVTGAASMDSGGSETPCINAAHSKTGATALHVAAAKGRRADAEVLVSNGADPLLKAKDGSSAIDWACKFNHTEIVKLLEEQVHASERADAVIKQELLLSQYNATVDSDEVDLNLIELLLSFVCGEGPFKRQDADAAILGAVLVFLPGWDEIIRLKDRLESSAAFRGGRYQILPLHSMVPAADQRKVFLRPPPGIRKIVLSTNIAETAVTIDDIVCVINSGRMKEKSYDPYTTVSTLMTAWISKASERQRRGRAGRCQPGVCFHLYSEARSKAMPEFQLAELQRTPLDELCLQVKLLEGQGFGSSRLEEFLQLAVEPPPLASVKNAIRLLEDIGALEAKSERLTLLGRHLAALPLLPRVGKMLLFGMLFDVLDPVLTVACCMAYRSPWVLPIDAAARKQALSAKRHFAEEAGGTSDHLALVKAYSAWAAAKAVGQERRFAAANYLSNGTMSMIEGMRQQLLGELQAQGFVRMVEDASKLAGNSGLVRSVLAAGFYPQVARLLPPNRGQSDRSMLLTASEEKVRVHPASLNSGMQAPPLASGPRLCQLLMFEEKTRTESTLSVMQTTAVTPHVLLLVANKLGPLFRDQQRGGAVWGRRKRRVGSATGESSEDETLEVSAWDTEDAQGSASWDVVEMPKGQGLWYSGDAPVRDQGLAAGPRWVSDDEEDGVAWEEGVLVDGWLSFSLPAEELRQLGVLRQRLTDCFAAKVAKPGSPLSPSHKELLAALSRMFILESGQHEHEARQHAHARAGSSGRNRDVNGRGLPYIAAPSQPGAYAARGNRGHSRAAVPRHTKRHISDYRHALPGHQGGPAHWGQLHAFGTSPAGFAEHSVQRSGGRTGPSRGRGRGQGRGAPRARGH